MIETVSHTKKVKTRKCHYCFACGRLHPPKSDMFRQVNVYDGEIGAVYHCEPCDIIMSEFSDYCIDAAEGVFPEGCVINLPSNCFNEKELEEYYKEPSPWKILDILRRTQPTGGNMKTAKEIAKSCYKFLGCSSSEILDEYYYFTPKELKVYIDTLCKEQRESCADNADHMCDSDGFGFDEVDRDSILNAPQPEGK